MVANCGMCGCEIEEDKEVYVVLDEDEKPVNAHLCKLCTKKFKEQNKDIKWEQI